MASFTAGTTFVDGVSNDVTAAKLGNLVTNATPTSGFIQDRTAETVVGVNDTLLIGDASDSNNLKRMTVANLLKAPLVSTSGTIDVLTTGTTTSTNEVVTNGTITNLSATTSTFLGAITGSTNVINIGSGQIYKDASGNVGVGTASPTAKLDVLAPTNTGIRVTNGTMTGVFFNTSDTLIGIGTTSSHPVGLYSNNAQRLIIDSVGNVNVGGENVDTLRYLDVSNTNSSANAGSILRLVTRNVADSGNVAVDIVKYKTGAFTIANTETNAAAFTSFNVGASERMRIDSSGNVGVGTASPTGKLHVYSANASDKLVRFGPGGINDGNFITTAKNGVSGSTNGTPQFSLGMDYSTTYTDLAAIKFARGDGAQGNILFFTGDQANGTERLRIDLNGRVGIGTTTQVNKLEIVGSFGRGAPVTKTGDFTLADTENWLIVNKGSSCTVTLPAASSWTGREFTIKVITAHAVVSASSNIIPRIGGAAATAILPATDGAWATLVSNGTNWEIMCGS